jgi:hypothetical protein
MLASKQSILIVLSQFNGLSVVPSALLVAHHQAIPSAIQCSGALGRMAIVPDLGTQGGRHSIPAGAIAVQELRHCQEYTRSVYRAAALELDTDHSVGIDAQLRGVERHRDHGVKCAVPCPIACCLYRS